MRRFVIGLNELLIIFVKIILYLIIQGPLTYNPQVAGELCQGRLLRNDMNFNDCLILMNFKDMLEVLYISIGLLMIE